MLEPRQGIETIVCFPVQMTLFQTAAEANQRDSVKTADKEGCPMALPAKQKQYTFADALTWDEGDHIEIGGEAFMMATPSTSV